MNNKATYANQRQLTINKSSCNGDKKENYYSTHNTDATTQAAFDLQSKAGFKLYIYLSRYKDKTKLAFSSKDFCAWSGVSRTAYTTAFEELEKYGYLVLKEGTETIYNFYDRPQKQAEKQIDEITIITNNFNF